MLEYLGAVIAGSCSVPTLKRKEEVVVFETCGENYKGESWLKSSSGLGERVTTNFQKPSSVESREINTMIPPLRCITHHLMGSHLLFRLFWWH